MEILDLRHFSSADLRPLLEQENQLWARLLSWDYSGSADMILRYVDSKILPGYAALDRGRVFGYAFFVYEGSKGVIGDLFVANGNGARGASVRETEIRLLTHVIETLGQSPGVNRVEAQLLAHESGSVAQPFLDGGFQRHPRLFMLLDLPESTPALEPSAEIEIVPWAELYYQPVAALITACYRGHIDSEVNDQYRTLSGSLRFLNNIVRFPGCGVFDPESSFVAVHKQLRNAVGVILCSRIRHDVGHVTQVCVLPELRGQGAGAGLMQAAFRAQRRRGFVTLSLTVTEANRSAVTLYERLGFRTRHVFDAFVWEG